MGGRDLWRKSQAYMDHVKWVAGGADNEMTVTHVASLKNIYISLHIFATPSNRDVPRV